MKRFRGTLPAVVLALLALGSASAAAVVTPPVTVSDPKTGGWNPRLAVTPAGYAIVGWWSGSVQLARMGSDGALTPPTAIGGPAADVASWGAAAADVVVGPSGVATVAWIDPRQNLRTARVAADGSVRATQKIGERVTQGVDDDVRLGIDERNRTTVAWEGKDRIRATRLAPDGSAGRTMALSRTIVRDLDLAVGADGRATAVWRSKRGVMSARITPAGRALKARRLDNGSPRIAFDPQVAASARGRAAVVWASGRKDSDDDFRVVYAAVGRNGTPTRARTLVEDARGPAVTYGRGPHGGRTHVAWIGRNERIGMGRITRNGRLRAVDEIPAPPRTGRGGLRLGVDQDGELTLVWGQGSGSASQSVSMIELARRRG